MEVETLNAMNEGMQASLMMIVEVIMLISIFFAVVGLVTYLAGFAWFCFEESGSLRRQIGHSQQGVTPALSATCRLPRHYNNRKLRIQLKGDS